MIRRWPPCLLRRHTDSTGDDVHNLDLSQRRAETVEAYLLLYGVTKDRLVCAGHGESKPVGDNATDEGRAAQNRVE